MGWGNMGGPDVEVKSTMAKFESEICVETVDRFNIGSQYYQFISFPLIAWLPVVPFDVTGLCLLVVLLHQVYGSSKIVLRFLSIILGRPPLLLNLIEPARWPVVIRHDFFYLLLL
jgi:hypothetical protein